MGYRLALIGIPCWGKKHYGPIGIAPDFMQNAFDLIFLLVFILYWKWSTFLVVSYYVIETIVMSIFLGIKITQYHFFNSSIWDIKSSTFRNMILSVVVFFTLLFSATLFLLDCRIIEQGDNMPSWKELALGEQEFLIGVLAILLQQVVDYIKYKKGRLLIEEEMVTLTVTQVMRIFVQQFAVFIGIVIVSLLSFIQSIEAAILIAIMVGLVKLTFGQLILIVRKNNE